jgi:hypothetical protein
MDTYEATHTLNVDFQFKSAGIAAQFFGRAQHFKNALKEFHWLDDSDTLSFKVGTQYPFLTLQYENSQK